MNSNTAHTHKKEKKREFNINKLIVGSTKRWRRLLASSAASFEPSGKVVMLPLQQCGRQAATWTVGNINENEEEEAHKSLLTLKITISALINISASWNLTFYNKLSEKK